jgi:hypothetical protein
LCKQKIISMLIANKESESVMVLDVAMTH